MADLKTACHCCKGSGEELDHRAVGAELRGKREARGLTQTRVATRMKISCCHLCDLELGRRNWREELIQRYLKALK